MFERHRVELLRRHRDEILWKKSSLPTRHKGDRPKGLGPPANLHAYRTIQGYIQGSTAFSFPAKALSMSVALTPLAAALVTRTFMAS